MGIASGIDADLSMEEIGIRYGRRTGEIRRYLVQKKSLDVLWETVAETKHLTNAIVDRDEHVRIDPDHPVRIVLYSVRTEALET